MTNAPNNLRTRPHAAHKLVGLAIATVFVLGMVGQAHADRRRGSSRSYKRSVKRSVRTLGRFNSRSSRSHTYRSPRYGSRYRTYKRSYTPRYRTRTYRPRSTPRYRTRPTYRYRNPRVNGRYRKRLPTYGTPRPSWRYRGQPRRYNPRTPRRNNNKRNKYRDYRRRQGNGIAL